MAESVKVTMNLPTTIWQALADLADGECITRTQALRRAITTEVNLHRVLRSGADVLIRHKDGTTDVVISTYATHV